MSSAIGIASMQLLLMCLAATLWASGVSDGAYGNTSPHPSAATLAHCQQSCGEVNISYPFGIGPGCFRPGFELTCSQTTQPSKLFLGNTTTEVHSQYAGGIAEQDAGGIAISIVFNVPNNPGVTNMTWKAPSRNFYIDGYFNTIGCGIEVTLFDRTNDTSGFIGYCASMCADVVVMRKEAEAENCNGMGCCRIPFFEAGYVRAFGFTITQNDRLGAQSNAVTNYSTIKAFVTSDSYEFSLADLWSDRLNTSTSNASLGAVIADKPNCESAQADPMRYACADTRSSCRDVPSGGYYCTCPSYFYGNNDDYWPNPYLLGGCTQETEYHPNPRNNCARSCGSTSIPFPFGLEPGCFAHDKFQLNCTSNNTILIGRHPLEFQVTNISIDEGNLYVKRTLNPQYAFRGEVMMNTSREYGVQDMFNLPDLFEFSQDQGVWMWEQRGQAMINLPDLFEFSQHQGVWMWVVNNLTCETAKKNNATYACVSANSKCLNVTHGDRYLGYRCKCVDGYEGNPYDHHNDCRGVAIGLGCGLGLIAFAVGAREFVRRWKRGMQKKIRRAYFRKNKGLLLEQLISSAESVTQQTKIFSLEELEKATNNFDPMRIVGRGGHGTVYKGILSDQHVVAIKRSKIVEQSEIDQFINEVANLSQIIHRNVVKLFGCCLESEVPLLVYEFISNGTLYDLLHCDLNTRCLLAWDDRIRIALEAAGALAYLHSAASIPIFHRDVKSANILLDNNFTTKVSDFGASRSISIDETHVVTIVQGTFGYLDPEYYHTGQLTEKSDVYSFGVILVELLTRKKPIFLNSCGEKQNLSHYFLQLLRQKTITEILDAQIMEEADRGEIDEMASLVELCLSVRGEERPTMKEVELRLQLLRATRTKKYQEELLKRDNEIKPLLPLNYNSTSRTRHIDFGKDADMAFQEVSRSYSMEQELVSWNDLPR